MIIGQFGTWTIYHQTISKYKKLNSGRALLIGGTRQIWITTTVIQTKPRRLGHVHFSALRLAIGKFHRKNHVKSLVFCQTKLYF